MKTVASVKDLERLAVSRGASASFAGRVVNSTRDKLNSIQKTEEPKQVEPAKAEEPPKQQEPVIAPPVVERIDLTPMTAAIEGALGTMSDHMQQMQQANEKLVCAIAQAMERVQAPVVTSSPAEAPKSNFRLKVNRDTRGFIETMDIVRVGS